MKILFKGSELETKKMINRLKNGDFEVVTSNGDYEIQKVEKVKSSIIGMSKNNYYIILPKDVIYVESFDHDVICHSMSGDYSIDEKLYEIAGAFIEYGFVRIHKSYVVNKTHIKEIIPEFNRKFRLIMTNNYEIEVSRRYFVDFKESIGMKVKS